MNKTTIIASAVALALGISACSEQKTLEQLLASANEFSQNRDFSSAVVELKNAVRLAPKSAEARLALGHAYLEQGNYIFAEKELEKSLELGMDLTNTASLIAKAKAKLAKYDDLQELVGKSSSLNDDDYIKVLIYAGISALAHSERDNAQDYIGQALSISENSAYSQLGKAYLAQSDEGYAEGLADIEILLVENPNFSEALLLKGHLQSYLKQYEQAAKSFAEYLAQHPLDYRINYFEIDNLIKAKFFDEAEVITDKLLKKFKSAPLALHYKSQLQYQKQNYTEAKSTAEQAIQAGSSLALTKLIAGTSAFQLKDYEQAYNHLIPIERFLPNTHPVQKIIAVVKLQLGYSSEAAENLLSLEGLTNEDSAFLQSSAASLVELGDFDSAQKLIEKAREIDPNNANVLTQSGLVSISQNNAFDAIKSLEQAIELDPSLIEVELALGMQYLKAGDDSKAQGIASKLIADHADNSSGYILQGVIYVKEKNNAKATDAFKKALLISPNNIASLYNLGIIYKDEQDSKASMAYFEQVIKLAPSHKGAILNYVDLAAKSNQLDHSSDFLKEISQSNNLVTTIALAHNLRLNSQVKEASILLETFADKKLLNTNYWSLLGDLYLQLKSMDKASAAFNEGLKLKPNHYLLNLRSIGMFEILKKYPEALAQTKSAYEYYPNNTRIEILLTHFEAKNNNPNAAMEMLNVIKQKGVEHHLVDSVFGSIALEEKNFEQAVESFSSAFDQKQSGENAIQLARALKFNGQQQEAEKVLESFLENNSNNSKIRFLLAELYSVDDRNKKIIQYKIISEVAPENVIALNNLAWNHYKVGNVERALQNIEKAYNLAAGNVVILESYGVILEAAGKYSDAINILEQAIVKGSNDSQVRVSLEKAKVSLMK